MPRYRANEIVMHTFTNQAQIDWAISRWENYTGIWYVGYRQAFEGRHLNAMQEELGEFFGTRDKLVPWWSVEEINLPG